MLEAKATNQLSRYEVGLLSIVASPNSKTTRSAKPLSTISNSPNSQTFKAENQILFVNLQEISWWENLVSTDDNLLL